MPCRAGQDDIRLVMESAGSVEGRIVSGEAGERVPAAQISVMPNGPGFFALGSRPGDRSDPDGTFRLNSLAAGSYRIQATFGTNTVPDWVAETAAACFRVAYAAVYLVAITQLVIALELLDDPDQALRAIDAYDTIWHVGLILFGVHLLLIGSWRTDRVSCRKSSASCW